VDNEGNGTKGIEARLRVGGRAGDVSPALRCPDLMPVVPSLQRRVCAIEPAEEFHAATTEVWQRISLTSGLIEHPASADVEAFGEFVSG
jgi:hypothetical protein